MLDKWLRLVVTGAPVTQEQAYEIILRTFDPYDLDRNPGAYLQSNCVLEDLGLPQYTEPHQNFFFDKSPNEEKLLQFFEAVQSLCHPDEDFHYLNNHQFTSSWIGGAHGWCNWDGQINTTDYNIGKYPSVEELLLECQQIAEAFPFLTDCWFQFLYDEGYGNQEPALSISVNKGACQIVKGEPLKDSPMNVEIDFEQLISPTYVSSLTYDRELLAKVLQDLKERFT